MNRIVITSHVDSNGILQMNLPLGPTHADQEVQITIEPVGSSSLSRDEWQRGIMQTAGKWQGVIEPDKLR